jgi:hypothetical protein
MPFVLSVVRLNVVMLSVVVQFVQVLALPGERKETHIICGILINTGCDIIQ